MRWVMTRVLPLPAPARISTGPSTASTASRWLGLSPARTCETSFTAASSATTRPSRTWRGCAAGRRRARRARPRGRRAAAAAARSGTATTAPAPRGTSITQSPRPSASVAQRGVARGRDGDHAAAARLHLLQVREHLLVDARPAGRARPPAGPRRSSAIGPCFISPAGVALGVDVRDLLQLERALERDRVVDARGRGTGSPRACASERASSSICGSRGERLLHQVRARASGRASCVAARGAPSSVPRSRPRCSASRASATSCAVKALVEATPISGPACVSSAPSRPRASASSPARCRSRAPSAPARLGLAHGGERVGGLAALADRDGHGVRRRRAASR